MCPCPLNCILLYTQRPLDRPICCLLRLRLAKRERAMPILSTSSGGARLLYAIKLAVALGFIATNIAVLITWNQHKALVPVNKVTLSVALQVVVSVRYVPLFTSIHPNLRNF